MPWKVDEETGNLITDEDSGNPIWVDGEKEEPFDPDRAMSNIQRLNSESAGRRKEIERLREQLKPIEGIDEPIDEFVERSRQAMEKVQALEDADLIEAGKVEDLKQQIRESYEGKLKKKDEALSEWEQKYQRKEQEIQNYMVGQQFSQSSFLNEETYLTPDIAQAAFGKYFDVEDGRIVARWENGEPIYSERNPGEHADFEEALRQVVNRYGNKDRILKGSGATGSGASSDATARKERGRWGHIKTTADFQSTKEKTEFIQDKGLQAFKELPAA